MDNTNKNLVTGVLVVIIIFVGAYLMMKYADMSTPDMVSENPKPEEQVAGTGLPVFTWTYEYFEDREYPQTELSLTARYEDDVVVTKKIDTVTGSCNGYDVRDKDVYAKSEMIICYYAGLGYYYKVVQSGEVYLVQVREFEEGSPDYNPPLQTFVTIEQF